jgi:hypothetical protein
MGDKITFCVNFSVLLIFVESADNYSFTASIKFLCSNQGQSYLSITLGCPWLELTFVGNVQRLKD